MKRVLITGANGIIGRILSKRLEEYELTLIDFFEVDVRRYNRLERLINRLGSYDAIIHLAWNTKTENHLSEKADPDNLLMAENVYQIALVKDIPRVVMASSIHADDFRNPKRNPLSPTDLPRPQSAYGRSKVEMETTGRRYSRYGLEVACIRFGAVGYGEPPADDEGKLVWLSERDCVGLVKSIIDTTRIPDNFTIVYGVSGNQKRVHDFSNPFGWKPKDGFKN